MPAEKVSFSHIGTWPVPKDLLFAKEFEDERRKSLPSGVPMMPPAF